MRSSLLGSARHASIAVDRIRIAEVSCRRNAHLARCESGFATNPPMHSSRAFGNHKSASRQEIKPEEMRVQDLSRHETTTLWRTVQASEFSGRPHPNDFRYGPGAGPSHRAKTRRILSAPLKPLNFAICASHTYLLRLRARSHSSAWPNASCRHCSAGRSTSNLDSTTKFFTHIGP